MKKLLIVPILALTLGVAPASQAAPPAQTAQGGSDCEAGNPELGDPLTAVSFPEDGSAREQWFEFSFDSGTRTLEAIVADDDPMWSFFVRVYEWDGTECGERVQSFARDTLLLSQLGGLPDTPPALNEPIPAGDYQVMVDSSALFSPGDGGKVNILAVPGP